MTIQELEQFIATYGIDIYSFCVYLTGNRPEAEGLGQMAAEIIRAGE